MHINSRLNREDFDRVLRELAYQGACDPHGGMEYFRVLEDWIAAGRPLPLARFIYTHANIVVTYIPPPDIEA
jgi:hypothetical protein